MPVYKRHRLLHIHIPKAAGTAIETLFHRLDDMRWHGGYLFGTQFRDDRWFELQHLSAPEIHAMTEGAYQDHSTFAIVRDPYERLVSDYLWRLQVQQFFPDSEVPSFESFEQFLAAVPTDIDDAWDEHIGSADRSRANLLIHTRPQYHYVAGNDEAIDPAIAIARFEELPHSLDPLLRSHGVDEHDLRETHRHDLADYYSDETLQLVNQIYARDFEAFSYPVIGTPAS